MNKSFLKSGLFILSMGISLSGWTAGPCMPIAMSCMKAGYYKGGEKAGKGLVKDCIMPVIAKKKVMPNTSFSDTVLQECKADLMAKMKEKAAM